MSRVEAISGADRRPPRVVVQDDGQTVRVLVFGSSGTWLAEAEMSARQALHLAQELLDAGLRHLEPAP